MVPFNTHMFLDSRPGQKDAELNTSKHYCNLTYSYLFVNIIITVVLALFQICPIFIGFIHCLCFHLVLYYIHGTRTYRYLCIYFNDQYPH